MANFSRVRSVVFRALASQTRHFLALDQSTCAYLMAREIAKASWTLRRQEWACSASSPNCELFDGSFGRRVKLLASSSSFSFWSKIRACSPYFTGLTCRRWVYSSRDDDYFAHLTGLSNTFASPFSGDSRPNSTWSGRASTAHSRAEPSSNLRSPFSSVLSKYVGMLCEFQSPVLIRLQGWVYWQGAVRMTHALKLHQWAHFGEFGYFCGLPNRQPWLRRVGHVQI